MAPVNPTVHSHQYMYRWCYFETCEKKEVVSQCKKPRVNSKFRSEVIAILRYTKICRNFFTSSP